MEKWKDIVGYEESYQISTEGDVRSKDRITLRNGKPYQRLKGKMLKPWKDTRGYVQVYLCFNGRSKPVAIHRLSLLTFIGGDNGKNTVNHLNGVLDDNRLINLEWTTQKENNRHAFKTGLMDSIIGDNNRRATISNETAITVYKMHLSGISAASIAKDLGLKYHTVHNIVSGKSFKRVIQKYFHSN